MGVTQNSGSTKGLKTTLVGIIASALLALIKALGGVFGNSYALIADAIESAADVFTSAMLWMGLKWSAKPPDENHPYGHGKAEALVAIGISVALMVAAGIIIRDSIFHIQRPHKTPAPFTLVILVLVILTKELLYRYVIRTGAEINSGAVKADAFHHRSDAITSAAAFVGISIALIGGEGFEVADDYAALLAGAFIIYNAYGIARPAIGELLDEEMDPELHDQIKSYASEVDGVRRIQQLRTRKMGTVYHIDLHVWVDALLTVREGHIIAHRVKDHILESVSQVQDVHIHIEPDSEPGN
ncbi:MAG TPA: cation-efflux pump [Cryomorphaceae bacterium]|nr:cation-efflux pump [Cryomorphaceae bacterium]